MTLSCSHLALLYAGAKEMAKIAIYNARYGIFINPCYGRWTALLRRSLATLRVADESRDVVMVPHRHKD